MNRLQRSAPRPGEVRTGRPLRIKTTTMKYDFLKYALLVLLFSAGGAACGDDDSLVKPEPSPIVVPELPERPALEVESGLLDLKKSTTKSLRITSGAGDYRVGVLDPSVASARVEGDQVFVEGLAVGKTDLLLSDGGGSYKTVSVSVYKSDEVTFDKPRLELVLKMGAAADGSFTITDGNAPYEVVSEHPEIATALLGEDGVTVAVKGLAAGETVVTVTDSRNLKATLVVVNTVQDSPFSEEELAQIKNEPWKTYVVNGKKIEGQLDAAGSNPPYYSGYIWGAYSLKATSNNLHLVSSGPVDMTTVGKKPGLHLVYKEGRTHHVTAADQVEANAEVIKSENGVSWITFYGTKDDKLYIGYLVVKPS